jgi:hypothetical protein
MLGEDLVLFRDKRGPRRGNGGFPWVFRPLEFLASATRRFLISAGAFHFVGCNAAVTVLVGLQDKLTRFVYKLAAGDLSILVFIKETEVCVGEGGSSPTDDCEFGRIEMPVAVAIGQGKEPIKVTLPLIAGVDAIVIGVPDVGSVRRRSVFC